MPEYKSPDYKLVKYFEGSRNEWKKKALNLRVERNNAEKRCKYHKEKSGILKRIIAELQEENALLLTQKEELEKKI